MKNRSSRTYALDQSGRAVWWIILMIFSSMVGLFGILGGLLSRILSDGTPTLSGDLLALLFIGLGLAGAIISARHLVKK